MQAFYTTPIFKLERLILKLVVSKPSSDTQLDLLIEGGVDEFSAWTIEHRCKNQLLMCDFQGRTRSWFMIEALEGKNGKQTKLYFSSAVVSSKKRNTNMGSSSLGFRPLFWFHRKYSMVLLLSAKLRLKA